MGPVVSAYRAARIRRAKRKAVRRQMLALSVPILAFFAMIFSRGFFGAGLQSVSEAAARMAAAAKRGEFAEAASALYDAARSLGSSITIKKLLLPIFLTVVLRLARARLIDSMNGRSGEANQREAAGTAPGTATDAGSGEQASDLNKGPDAGEAESLSFEWPRRLEHSISGLVILVLYLALPFYLALACVLVAIFFLYCVGLLRRLSRRFNGLYVQLLKGIIRSREENPAQHPSAFPFVWGCLLVLLLSTRSLAILSVLLLSLGDPAAGICRVKCRRWAAAASSKALDTKGDVKRGTETNEDKTSADCAAAELGNGCCCNSGSNKALNKRCYWGFLGCVIVCVASVIMLALCMALISRFSPALSVAAKYENPVLHGALASSGLAYPWPFVLQPVVDAKVEDPTKATHVSIGWRLLACEPQSWFLLIAISLGIGVVAAAAETVDIRGMDDNLTMPVICMLCFASFFALYAHLKGLAGASLGPEELSTMSSLDLLMLLLFAL